MVGIVIVSHSAKIAEGIKDMAIQMADKNIKIIAAGGMADGNIGTDAFIIREALLNAEDGDGVVIFADLGSALLSTYTAFELLGKDNKDRFEIADAPIVEGAISAAVQASLGSSLNDVIAAAEAAGKIRKL